MPSLISRGTVSARGFGFGATTATATTTAIAVAHTTTPFISTYPWSAGFGTKYANPATLPTGNATTGNSVAFTN